MSRSYPAKLLLFGEYTVLSGSQALAVPLSCWKGRWVKNEAPDVLPSFEFFDWLRKEEIIAPYQYDALIADRNQGWYYDANVPIGYGVGSSGAYVAAIFDRYMSDAHQDAHDAATVMARMESFFHGTSSGMDPLVSFTEQAVVKEDSGLFRVVQDPGWPDGWRLFLLDSGEPRHTGALVHVFRSLLEQNDFKIKVERSLIPMVEHAIHFYLSGTVPMLEDCIQVISQFQREYFTPMIPDAVGEKWDNLVGLPGVYVKLCGAGGGGFFLVLSTQNADLSSFDLVAV